MPEYRTPGIYIEEVPAGPRPIAALGTSVAAFVGVTSNRNAPRDSAVAVNNWTQFANTFLAEGEAWTPLAHAVFGYFQNGGQRCYVVAIKEGDAIASNGSGSRKGLAVLEEVDEVAIVAAPGYCDSASYEALLGHCERMRDRIAILDCPEKVDRIQDLVKVRVEPAPSGGEEGGGQKRKRSDAGGGGLRPRNSDDGFGAYYFPWITVRDPSTRGRVVNVPPCGHLAGIYARTDTTRGVHKAPANEPVRGALNLAYRLTDQEQGELNDNGVNCIRFFSREGIRVWGARTVAPSASEWRYLNVRRLFSMIEESIARGTRWVVFEPNDLSLWKAIRRDVSAFLTLQWRAGALFGQTAEEAFFVKCDEETNPPEVINEGRVVIVVGIAPVKPAEFVIFRISQQAGAPEE